MAWELLKQNCCTGHEFEGLGYMTIEQLQSNPNIKVVSFDSSRMARDMIIGIDTYAYTADNEYFRGKRYDVYNETYHPNVDIYPLNVYGQAMLNDYLYFHDIQEDT